MAESGDGSGSPATYEVVRQAKVMAAPDAIFDQLEDFHRWPAWSPWESIDPDMVRTYEGQGLGVGAAYGWKGNRKAGEGRMEVIESHRPSSIRIALTFVKPFKSKNTIDFSLVREGDATLVTWTMTGPKTLMTRVMGIFTSMDKLVGPDFEKGLAQLKAVVEA